MSITKTKSKFGTVIYNHVYNNKNDYLIVTILFFVGVFLGVLFINNCTATKIEEICNYLINLCNNIKQYNNIDLLNLLKQSLISNIIIIAILWFGASTIIGIPIVYGTIIFKGFTLGYTVSSLLNSFGFGNGILISLSLLLLHNLIFIPTIFATAVSGVKLYKSIMKNKDRDNIRLEILRHTIFCTVMLIIIIICSFIEVYISTNISILLLKNIKI